MNQTYDVHAPLSAITVWVKEDVFYNFEKASETWIKCKVFGLTCLRGQVPVFDVLTEDGYIFSDIPPHLMRWKDPGITVTPSHEEGGGKAEKDQKGIKERAGNEEGVERVYADLRDLVYNNCLSETFAITEFPELKQRSAFVFLKGLKQYVAAQYWLSVDFYEHNNWFHAMKLDNGQLAFLPSHKMVFPSQGVLKENHEFPAYKKLRKTFSV